MMMVTKRVEFCAAHRLALNHVSEEENLRMFGKCAKGSGHGHNYTLEVTIGGEMDPKTGMVYDIKKLKELIHHEIIQKVDHMDLNDPQGLLQGKLPTTENLALRVWDILSKKMESIKLVEVKIWETSNNSVCYRGESS